MSEVLQTRLLRAVGIAGWGTCAHACVRALVRYVRARVSALCVCVRVRACVCMCACVCGCGLIENYM